MGRHHYAKLAPFKINIDDVDQAEGFKLFHKFMNSNSDWELNFQGWFCEHPEWIEYYGDLYCLPIVKGNIKMPDDDDSDIEADMKVLYVNESPYSNVGGEVHCFFSKSKRALVQLCKDFGFDAKQIEKNGVVEQTI
jgi:hypothetical protein